MSIGDKVADLRTRRGLTQQQLAEATGIPQATISRIERGVLPRPKLDALTALAEALDVTVDYLADRTERMSASDVVEADSRAQAMFRGYQSLSEEDKQALSEFVRFLVSRRRQRRRREEGTQG